MRAADLGPDDRVVRDPAIAEVQVDGETVLYHEELRTVCVLNPTASVIWSRLDGREGLDVIAFGLAAEFDVDTERVRRDVLSTVRSFGLQGLLAGVDADPAVVAELLLVEPDAEPSSDG